jgi:two-component system chemotaxis sensor kinase CheA
VVDGLEKHVDAVIRDLGPHFAGLPGVAGAIMLGNGEIALALHPPDLLEIFHRARGSLVLSLVATEEEAQPASILVVDDSITTRALEKSILEAHGYRVRVAVDGAEAYSQLQAEPADLIVSDVEMPRMDGFALLEAVRRDPHLKETPLILVTSLEQREHKERGLSLGADAYVVKRNFEQTDLLETIRQLL